MKACKVLLFLLFVPVGVFLWWQKDPHEEIESDETDTESVATSASGASVVTPLLEMKDLDITLKEFYDGHDKVKVCDSQNGKYENLIKTLDNYIQRYVNLFLVTSELVNYKTNDVNEVIEVDLQIKISGEDLAFLQEYSKAGKKSMYLRNLHKLDAIFSNLCKLKQKSYLEKFLAHAYSFSTNTVLYLYKNFTSHRLFAILIIFFLSSATYSFDLRRLGLTFGIIIQSMMVWDSFSLYWSRVKEKDLAIYVKSLQFKQVPEDCDPMVMNWYERLYSTAFGSSCLEYYQNMRRDPLEEVSLLMCIVETWSLYFIKTPVKILGASLRDFIGEVTDLWPWPIKYFVAVPLAPCFVVCVAVFILILSGKRLRMSFFGAAVEVGDSRPRTGYQKPPITSDSGRRAVRDIRKLRPWTKPRFFKNRAFASKVFKSSLEMPGNSKVGPTDSASIWNAAETKTEPEPGSCD